MILTCISCEASVLGHDAAGRPMMMRYEVTLEGGYGDLRVYHTVHKPVAIGTRFDFELAEVIEGDGCDEPGICLSFGSLIERPDPTVPTKHPNAPRPR